MADYHKEQNFILSSWVNVTVLHVSTNFMFQIAFGSHFNFVNFFPPNIEYFSGFLFWAWMTQL